MSSNHLRLFQNVVTPSFCLRFLLKVKPIKSVQYVSPSPYATIDFSLIVFQLTAPSIFIVPVQWSADYLLFTCNNPRWKVCQTMSRCWCEKYWVKMWDGCEDLALSCLGWGFWRLVARLMCCQELTFCEVNLANCPIVDDLIVLKILSWPTSITV